MERVRLSRSACLSLPETMLLSNMRASHPGSDEVHQFIGDTVSLIRVTPSFGQSFKTIRPIGISNHIEHSANGEAITPVGRFFVKLEVARRYDAGIGARLWAIGSKNIRRRFYWRLLQPVGVNRAVAPYRSR